MFVMDSLDPSNGIDNNIENVDNCPERAVSC